MAAWPWNDKYEREAKETMPVGYFVVTRGEIKPSDLVYSWPTKEWLSADDPSWSVSPTDVVMSVCIIREKQYDSASGHVQTFEPVTEQSESRPGMLF